MKKSVLTILLVLFVGCSPTEANPSETNELMKIRLPMGYIPNVQYAPYYVADEMGFYAEAGFEIEFDYSFETDGVTLVGAGELPFALVSGEQVLLARAQEIPIVYVMTWFQNYPIAIIASKESGVKIPRDLSGKEIGLPGLFGANYIGLQALLMEGGVDEMDVTLNAIGFNQVELFAAGKEEIVVGYITNEPVHLRAQGFDITIIPVAEYIEMPATGIITNELMLQENPELVAKFVQATLRGLRYTIENPDKAFEVSTHFVDGLAGGDQEIQMEVLELSIEYWNADILGNSDLPAWDNMQSVLLEMGLLYEAIDLDGAVTNQFIE